MDNSLASVLHESDKVYKMYMILSRTSGLITLLVDEIQLIAITFDPILKCLINEVLYV